MYRKFLFPALLLCAAMLHGQEQAYEAGKLSPATAHFIREYNHTRLDTAQRQAMLKRYAVKRQSAGDTRVNAFVTLHEGFEPESLPDTFGLRIITRVPSLRLFTASVPAGQLEALARHPAVQRVEMGTPVNLTLDEARPAANVDEVQQGSGLPSSYTGKGVVVGIVDGGFQYNHRDFYSKDGSTYRVKRVWDTNVPDSGKYETEEAILAAAYDLHANSWETHATHVAGIAAGADTTQGYQGVAPDAELVFVSYSNDNASIINGIQYIYDYADSVGKPAVVNLSLGMHVGPHDGTSQFDRVCDALQGEGRLLVGAAGNEAADDIHISKTFTPADTLLRTFIEYTPGYYAIADLWSDAGQSFSIEPVLYNLQTGEETSLSHDTILPVDGSHSYDFPLSDYTGSRYDALSIYATRDPNNDKANAYVAVALTRSLGNSFALGLKVSATQGTVQGWCTNASFADKGVPGWTAGDEHSTMGEIGGTGNRIITVGAYTSKDRFRNTWGQTGTMGETLGRIATFSSLGPTPDGRTKPDIAAPGTVLISAFTDKTGSLFSLYRSYVVSREADSYYGAMQGTSMASPFVTGVLATWLEAKPDLTPEEVRSILSYTAINDDYTGDLAGVPDNTWGYGKIDALAGIRQVIALRQRAEYREQYGDIGVLQDMAARRISLHFYTEEEVTQVAVRFYTIAGQQMGSTTLAVADPLQPLDIDVSLLPPGIYVLDVSAEGIRFEPQKVVLR